MNASAAQLDKLNSARKNIFMSIDEPIVKAWKASGERQLKLQQSLEEVLQEVLITPRNEEEMLENVGELLQFYPGLVFNKDEPESVALWRDLLKAASPKNKKNQLEYDPVILAALLESELQRMLEVRNNMRHVLTVMGPPANKVMLLKIVGILEGCPQAYNLGSGSRCDTRRVILMYEAESGVIVKKRKSYKKACSSQLLVTFVEPPTPASSSSSVPCEDGSEVMTPTPSQPGVKRRKLLIYPAPPVKTVSSDSALSPDGVSQVDSMDPFQVMDYLQAMDSVSNSAEAPLQPCSLTSVSEDDIRFDLTNDLDVLQESDEFLELLGFGDE